ncbi:MAG: NAD-dependent protein deacylase [Lachnospiraceae bacterium]|nr:NAD-dependent protein deacylase [Lachnospiraceae bacterium]
MLRDEIEQLQSIIGSSKNLVFFGGAGVSTESGIPDFRSAEGLFVKYDNRQYAPEEMVSHSFFMNHRNEFFDFYKNKMMYLDAKPNAAHIFLAKLEEAGKLKAIVTQNIDGLHQMAGSKTVYEVHGSIHRNYCMKCKAFYDAAYVKNSKGVPVCSKCGGDIKPDVVLYGESLDGRVISESIDAIGRADTLIIGGTSLAVYPAAGFVEHFRGENLVVINKTSTMKTISNALLIQAPIGEVFSSLIV